MLDFGYVDMDELLREIRNCWLTWKDTLPWTDKEKKLSRSKEYIAYVEATCVEIRGKFLSNIRHGDIGKRERILDVHLLEAIRKSGDYTEWLYQLIRWWDDVTDTDTPIHRVDIPLLFPVLYDYIACHARAIENKTGKRGERPVMEFLYNMPIYLYPSNQIGDILEGVISDNPRRTL